MRPSNPIDPHWCMWAEQELLSACVSACSEQLAGGKTSYFKAQALPGNDSAKRALKKPNSSKAEETSFDSSLPQAAQCSAGAPW